MDRLGSGRPAVRLPVLLLVIATAWLAGACAGGLATPTQPAPAQAAPLALPAGDEEAIRWLLQAEGEGVVAKDIDALMRLWSADGYVVDARHTPADTADDLAWRGEYAVRDRYITVVFTGNPAQAAPSDLDVAIQGDRAEVTATTRIGDEVSPAGDRWTFVRTAEGWRIESLTYNLEAE